MIHIKQFFSKMAAIEARQNRDVVLPMADARGLRDDIAQLLADLHENSRDTANSDAPVSIEIKGGSFK